MTSSDRRTFFANNFDRNELGTWGWCHSVRLVKAHRLTCNMTYLGHTVTLTWRDSLTGHIRSYSYSYSTGQLEARDLQIGEGYTGSFKCA